MRLQQPIMSGSPAPYLRNISKTTARDSKTPAPVPISDGERERFSPENQRTSLNVPSLLRSPKSRHCRHLKGNERIYLFYCLQQHTAMCHPCVCVCARAHASVEALLPCKGGTRFDCPVFVKWRPLERRVPFYLCPFCQTPRRARLCTYAEWTR